MNIYLTFCLVGEKESKAGNIYSPEKESAASMTSVAGVQLLRIGTKLKLAPEHTAYISSPFFSFNRESCFESNIFNLI